MLIRQRECHSYYRDVHYYVIIICPAHSLLIGYDASRHAAKNEHVHFYEKTNIFTFRRSQIEVKLQL